MKQFIKNYFSLLAVCMFLQQTLFAQPLSLRKTWEGAYDIRMTGSMVLQPAFVSSTYPVDVSGFITDEILRRSATEFSYNNRYNDFPTTNRLLPNNVRDGFSITDPCPFHATTTCPNTSTSTVRYNTTTPSIALVYADCDDDNTTFHSSWAYLNLGDNTGCTTIQSAYLYWAGEGSGTTADYAAYKGTPTMKSFSGGAVGNVDINTYKTIKFKAPGDANYTDVTALTVFPETFYGNGQYICVADVTEHMKGKTSGNYWVANVQTSSRGSSGVPSGWCLVVVFTPPNCPSRHIVLYDGRDDRIGSSGKQIDIPLTGLKTPSTADFKSYLGIAVLDGENTASAILSSSLMNKTVTKLDGTDVNIQTYCDFETLDFKAGGPLVKINPFATDQPSYRFADKYGVPISRPQPTRADVCNLTTFEGLNWTPGIDGVSSSRITTYDEVANTNGNDIPRMPDLKNTIGLDAHHFRLPQGAITQGDTEATMTVYSGAQGGTTPFLAYIAIETIQPTFNLTKTANISTTPLGQEIEYKLKVENMGGLASLADAYILDTLDILIDFVPGSVQYLYGKTPPLNFEITNQGQDQNEVLKFYLPEIAAADVTEVEDSVVILFKGKVKNLIGYQDLLECRRVIKNRALAFYRGNTGSSMQQTKSNEYLCSNVGIFAEVTIDDSQLSPVAQKIEASSKQVSIRCKNTVLNSARTNEFYNTPMYQWQNGNTTASFTIPDDYNTQNTYWVKTYSDCKVFRDTFLVSIPAKIQNSLTKDISEKICADGSTIVTLNATQSGVVNETIWEESVNSSTWTTIVPNNGTLSTKVSPLQTTSYKVISQGLCESPETTPVSIETAPVFTVDLFSDNTAYSPGAPITLTVTESLPGAYTYLWNNNLPYVSQNTFNTLAPADPGTISYTVTVKDADGLCTAEDAIDIEVGSLPTAITPYSQDGKNDTFADGYAVVIFNRIGQVVYDSKGAKIGWDAKVNGSYADPGVYYYILNGIVKGTVEVVRNLQPR